MKDDFFTEEELREKLEELKKKIRRSDWILCGIGFVTIAILIINRARG